MKTAGFGAHERRPGERRGRSRVERDEPSGVR
jgi:hypothetical protein